jgi:hypothetical protein
VRRLGGFYFFGVRAERHDSGFVLVGFSPQCQFDSYPHFASMNNIGVAVDFADYLSIGQLVSEVISTVACGGNILINVGYDAVLVKMAFAPLLRCVFIFPENPSKCV